MFSADLGGITASSTPTSNDPPFQKVALLLHGDGTNGAQNNTFVDSSTNNFTITRTGNVAQGTFSPFSLAEGQWSNYFDGTGDYLTIPANTAFNLSGTSFTLEAWVYRTATTSAYLQWVVGKRNVGFPFGYSYAFGTYNGNLRFIDSTNAAFDTSAFVPLHTWCHIAATYDGTALRQYLNGTLAATHTITITDNSADVTVGNYSVDNPTFTGYISNVRIVKGTAVYTSNFPPPTSALTAISGTSLLTCQSNRFKDNSSNNFTITRTGDTRVTAFSPFEPGAPYIPSINGGSAYFDGSGDWLTTPDNAGFDFGKGDFTIECFVFHTTASGSSAYVEHAYGGVGLWRNGAKLSFAQSDIANLITSTNDVPVNQWVHVAASRSGTALRIWINGVQEASVTNSTDFTSTSTFKIGSSTGLLNMVGYISNVRVIKGTALYTSNFTPPTAPLTAVANTQLLLNCTNAGIIDNAGKNDIETVGNAQISTSVKKYGTGSLAFVRSPSSYLVANNSSGALSLGSGNFTVEAWIYMNTLPSANGYDASYWIVGGGPVNSNTGFDIAIGSTNLQVGLTSFGSLNINTAHGMSLGVWYHIAIVRSGSTLYAFKDGVQLATATVSGVTADPCLTGLAISAAEPTGSTSGNFNGYIDDLRITKGQALYTSNFTPPTQAFPNV